MTWLALADNAKKNVASPNDPIIARFDKPNDRAGPTRVARISCLTIFSQSNPAKTRRQYAKPPREKQRNFTNSLASSYKASCGMKCDQKS
jgi:hypothetical protein